MIFLIKHFEGFVIKMTNVFFFHQTKKDPW